MTKPTKEFTAIFSVICAVWVGFVLVMMINCASLWPNDIRAHAVLYPMSFMFMFVGALAIAAFPPMVMWNYVTSE